MRSSSGRSRRTSMSRPPSERACRLPTIWPGSRRTCRSAASGARRNSPTWRASSPPTQGRTSPAPRSTSTAGARRWFEPRAQTPGGGPALHFHAQGSARRRARLVLGGASLRTDRIVLQATAGLHFLFFLRGRHVGRDHAAAFGALHGGGRIGVGCLRPFLRGRDGTSQRHEGGAQEKFFHCGGSCPMSCGGTPHWANNTELGSHVPRILLNAGSKGALASTQTRVPHVKLKLPFV